MKLITRFLYLSAAGIIFADILRQGADRVV